MKCGLIKVTHDVSHKHAEYHMNKYIQVSSNDITFLIMVIIINFMKFSDVEKCYPCSIHFSSVKRYSPHINLFSIYMPHIIFLFQVGGSASDL